MFLGWYDADRHKSAREKVRDAIDAYFDKFDESPCLCLTSVADAAELVGDCLIVEVRGVTFIPRHTFYVGYEDPPAEVEA